VEGPQARSATQGGLNYRLPTINGGLPYLISAQSPKNGTGRTSARRLLFTFPSEFVHCPNIQSTKQVGLLTASRVRFRVEWPSQRDVIRSVGDAKKLLPFATAKFNQRLREVTESGSLAECRRDADWEVESGQHPPAAEEPAVEKFGRTWYEPRGSHLPTLRCTLCTRHPLLFVVCAPIGMNQSLKHLDGQIERYICRAQNLVICGPWNHVSCRPDPDALVGRREGRLLG